MTESYATGTVTGDTRVGGLVGYTEGGIVSDSYASGTVGDGNTDVGGLVGENRDTIERSYAIVDVPTGAGGFIGTDNGGTVTAGYWDNGATGVTESADGEGLSTFEMTSLVAKDYMDLDFEGTWNATDRYPRLAWEGLTEPDPYPTAAPGEGEVWLLNDSDTGYYHNYSINSSGDVRWLGEVVASPGSADSAQLIEIAAGNATEAYDTLVVGNGTYEVETQEVNLTAGDGNLAHVFSYAGSERTNITRSQAAGNNFDPYTNATFRIDNPAASTLTIGDAGAFATDDNSDGGFYVESANSGASDSPLIGAYEVADEYNLTVNNTDFGMATNHGDTILLHDDTAAFTLELDLRSHSGAVINASAASGVSVINSTITEENDPRGNGLDGEGISFLTLDASGLDDVTIENVTVDGATENTEVDGAIEIVDLNESAAVEITELSLTDTGTHGLVVNTDIETMTVDGSEIHTVGGYGIETDARLSAFELNGTNITKTDQEGLYLRGVIDDGTVSNNRIVDTETPIDIGMDELPDNRFEITANHFEQSSGSLVVARENATATVTDNTLLDSGLQGVFIDAADSVVRNNDIDNSSERGIHLTVGADDTRLEDNEIVDSGTVGIDVDNAKNVTIRNATVETTGEYGIRFADGSTNGEVVESTIRNTTDYAFAVRDAVATTGVTVAVTDLDLGSGTISANVTDASLNTTTVSNGPQDYQSGNDAIRIARNTGSVDNLTLSYNTSAFTIDQRSLTLWQEVGPNWNSRDSTVDTDRQVVMTTETIDGVGVLTTFASNVSINANDTTVDEGEAGTIELNATNGDSGLENVELNVTFNSGPEGELDGIDLGETVMTDANGEATVAFQEDTEGTYDVTFRWTNNTLVSDTATVTVESTGSGSGGGGGGSGGGGSGDGGSGGGAPPASTIEQTIVDDGTTDITGGRSGDVVAINDETLRRSGSVDGLDNIAVDGLSIELATDRDFWIDVETYERGEEDAVDTAAGSTADNSDSDADELADAEQMTITASFERETETVSVGYVTVTHNLEPEDIADVTFDFSVRDVYLDDLDVDPEDVELYRQAKSWSALSTEYRELSGGRYRFSADSPGFSSFAIGTNAPLSIVIDGTLDQPAVVEGETATATATINNRGENPVTHTVELRADGEVVDAETVTVSGGKTVVASLGFDPAAGNYAMAVDEVDIGSLSVDKRAINPLWIILLIAGGLGAVLLWRRRDDAVDEPEAGEGTDNDTTAADTTDDESTS